MCLSLWVWFWGGGNVDVDACGRRVVWVGGWDGIGCWVCDVRSPDRVSVNGLLPFSRPCLACGCCSSSYRYLHKKDFLERCDYRQFEQERDARNARRATQQAAQAGAGVGGGGACKGV